MSTVGEHAWRAKGVELFGDDDTRWQFVCPRCKNVMSIAQARELPAEQLERLRAGKYSIEQECIGRHLQSVGCDWAAYGLFSGPVFVEREGKKTPVFDFAGAPFTGEQAL